MILECPACHARFSVADSAIPPAGRVVRCGKCANEWHVERPGEEPRREEETPREIVTTPPPAPVPEETPSIPSFEAAFKEVEAGAEESADFIRPRRSAPVPPPRRKRISPRPFKIAAPLLAALWLAAAFVAYFPSWMGAPGLSGIYEAAGAVPVDGLDFADVTMERVQEGSKTKFILSGSIRNHAGSARLVPTVRVLLKDASGKALWGREYPVNSQVKAGEVYPFRITNVETAFAKSVSSIVMDVGHPLQLLVR